MGWFGMPGCNRESAFNELFSQSQYTKEFELVWQKHMKSKSIAVYRIDGRLVGETILWADDGDELMYKPISWVDSVKYIPKLYHKELLEKLISDRKRLLFIFKILSEVEKRMIKGEACCFFLRLWRNYL